MAWPSKWCGAGRCGSSIACVAERSREPCGAATCTPPQDPIHRKAIHTPPCSHCRIIGHPFIPASWAQGAAVLAAPSSAGPRRPAHSRLGRAGVCVAVCVRVHVYASSRGGRIVQRCCSLVCAAPPALINLTRAPVQQHGRAPFRPLTIAASPPATPSRHRQVHAVFAQLCPSVGLALGLAAAQAPLAAEAQGIMGGVVSWVAGPLPPWSTQRAAPPRTRPATCLRHAPPTTCTTLLAMGCPTAGSAAGGRGCVRVLG